MKTQDLRAALVAERRRRQEAEAKLSRALENNTALARGNLRLQEQCARLRGEADLRQHEDGCRRAATAAREQEAAAKLARLQSLVRRGSEEREALLRQLAGKQEVIAYLEGKLAELAVAGGARGSASGKLGAGPSGGVAAGVVVVGVQPPPSKPAGSDAAATDSLDTAAPAPAGQEPRQRVPLVASEEEEALSVGEEASSGSPAMEDSTAFAEWDDRGSMRAGTVAAAEQQQAEAPSQPAAPPGGSAAAGVDATPLPQKQRQGDRTSAGVAPPTIQRTSLRARNSISYAEPSLSSKLRQGDPFTFGAAEAAAAGGGKQRGRARTKPRPRFAAGAAPHSGGQRREALPPMAD